MSLPHISPAKAKALIDRGAVLVDIREFDERARSRIPAARHAPLSRLDKLEIGTEAPAVICTCRMISIGWRLFSTTGSPAFFQASMPPSRMNAS